MKKIKLSCKCKSKVLDMNECPEFPWIKTEYHCLACNRAVKLEIEETKEEDE